MWPLRFRDRVGETRRGQAMLITVVILSAIAIVGLGFATFITQSFETSERTSDIARADALAREGLQWATRHLITSPEGADWRPLIQEVMNQGAIRMEDLDAQFDAFEQSKGWNLIDPHNGFFVKRKVGRGSFLVFVEYLSPGVDYDTAPESHPELVGNTEAFEILNKLTIFHSKADNEHRGSLKIISIGRPADGETTYRRIDAYMPLPMVQHSRFITATATGLKETLDLEEGTILGENLVPFDGDGSLNAAESSASKLRLSGPIRFNTDVTWVGDNEATVRSPNTLINPYDSDGLLVAGEISIPPNAMRPTWETLPQDTEPTWSFKSAPATLKILDEDTPINAKSSDDISVAADLIPLRGRPRLRDLSTGVVQSLKEGDLARFSDPFQQARYVQPLSPPSIDVKGAHGLERYRALTQYANAPESLRGYHFVDGTVRGIYIDNFADIQKDIPGFEGDPLRQVIRDWREPPPLGNSRRTYSSSARENPSGWAFNKWLDRNYPQTYNNSEDTNNYRELIGDSNPGDPSLYVPPGVEIVVTSTHTGVVNGDARESNLRYDGASDYNNFPANNPDYPDVVLIRHDGDLEGDRIREVRSFRPTNPISPQEEAELRARPVNRLAFDYDPLLSQGNAGAVDPNATLVIFAEGNVRIRGGGVDDDGDRLADEDPEEDAVDEDGDGKDGEDPIEDPRIATNLIVVSMGTIYIEGSLQTKNGAQIALMARDHICVNTTAMLPRLARIDVSDGDVELKEDVTGTWDPDEVNTHWEFERPGAANSVLRYQLPVSYLDGRNTWLQSGDGDGKAFWLTLLHSGVDNTDEPTAMQAPGQLFRFTPNPTCPYYQVPNVPVTVDPIDPPPGFNIGVHMQHQDEWEWVYPDDDEDKPWTLFRAWLTLKGPSGSYGDLYLLANPDDLAHRLFPDQPRDGFAFDQRHTTRYTKLPGRLHHPFSTRVVDVDWLGSLPNLENVQNLSPIHGVLNVQSPENREAGSNQIKTEYRFSRAKVERMQLLAGGNPDNPNHYRPSFVYPARIDAALFAQRGCFYVLPIPLFDSKPRDLAPEYPGYPAGGTVGGAAIDDDRWTAAAADPDEFTQRYVERFRHFNYFGWYDDTSDSRSSDDPSRYHGMILRGSITEFAPAQTFLRQIYPANAKLQAGVEDALDKLSYPVYDMNSGKIEGWRTLEFEFAPELAQNLRQIPLHDLGTWDPVLKKYDPVDDKMFNGPGEFAWAPRLPYLPVSPDVIIGHVRR